MTAQDDYTAASSRSCPAVKQLVARLRELFYYDAISAPAHRKGSLLLHAQARGQEKSIVYWKQGEKGDERVLFDPNQ